MALVTANALGLNDLKIVKEFENAHKLGHPHAAFNLGHWYETHSWTQSEDDNKRSGEWYRLAANDGNERAQMRLDEIGQEKQKKQTALAKLEKARLEKQGLEMKLVLQEPTSENNSESEQN